MQSQWLTGYSGSTWSHASVVPKVSSLPQERTKIFAKSRSCMDSRKSSLQHISPIEVVVLPAWQLPRSNRRSWYRTSTLHMQQPADEEAEQAICQIIA
jgi:hypothetical protein